MGGYVVEMSYFDIKKLYDILMEVMDKIVISPNNMDCLESIVNQFYTLLDNDMSKLHHNQKYEERYRVVLDKGEIYDLIFVCSDVNSNWGYYNIQPYGSHVYFCRNLCRVLESAV